MPKKYEANEDGIEAAVHAVRDGKIVVYPTETAYALGGDAVNEQVIDTIYKLKERPREKGLTVIVGSVAMAERYARLDAHERHLCAAFMPGPLTLVAEKKRNVPNALNDKFVFRVPGSETAREIAKRADTPVIATSANISGEPTSYRVDAIADSILREVDVIVDAGELAGEDPSTIVELAEHEVRIHREGPVTREQIAEALNE